MDQHVKMLAANSDDLNLIPRNLHGRRIDSQKLSSDVHMLWYMYTTTYKNKCNKHF